MKTVHKYKFWIISTLIILAFFVQLYIIVEIIGFGWQQATAGAVTNTLVIGLGIWGLLLLIKSYPTKVSLYPYALVMALLVSVCTILADWQVLKWLMKLTDNSPLFIHWFNHTMPVRFLLIWVFYSWIATNSALWKNIDVLNTRFQEHADAAILLREAELFKLRQQLQPHFLYNSLNSISALVMISPDKSQDMIGKLSDFLRDSVKRESEDMIPLEEEIRYIESYLAIESVRFGDRLKVNLNKGNIKQGSIPPFLFQPLLENAIKFGLYGKAGQVEINITISTEGDLLLLCITNPYDSTGLQKGGTGFGLKGVGRRLYLLFARNDLLETTADGAVFTTILKIPQHV